MFRKPTKSGATPATHISLITRDMHLIGNIVSDGHIDFDGTLDGNIRCQTLTVRANASINGEVVADTLLVYGRVKGLIRAKSVNLFAKCQVEGIVMHETLTMEDGAFLDGKCKRTDKQSGEISSFGNEEDDIPLMENLRLIN